MKKSWTWAVIIIIVVLILGYLGRHKIRTILSGASTQPPAQTVTNATPVPSVVPSPSDNGLTMARTDTAKGQYLADTKGMTLYSYDKDTKGVSNCNAGCAKAWPPFLQSSSPAPSPMPEGYTIIKRADGTMQYAFGDKPLYYYASDAKPGDITGDGVGGVWHLVKP